MIGLSVRVEGGSSGSWGNLSWVIPDVAVIYPVHVAISAAPVLVTGVPSLLSFVAPLAGDIVLQLHPQPAAEEVARSRHIVIEQRRPAAAGGLSRKFECDMCRIIYYSAAPCCFCAA